MKSKFIVFALLVLISVGSKAQSWVTIPDANFVSYLQANYPSCMVGNQMDTTCFAITTATTVNVNSLSISDLSGLQYFVSLQNLYCQDNQLTTLPPLPPSITTFTCATNLLTSLPTLPPSLTTFFCYDNQLTTLPTLPNSISSFNCSRNHLISLPNIPNSLSILNCYWNQLTSLPTLPNSLLTINCFGNQLVTLPALPNSLQTLLCDTNQIANLPVLPSSLLTLKCNNNLLASLPVLPSALVTLECNNNTLTNLPLLPSTLTTLSCKDNLLTGLPSIPNAINYLHCENNQLTSLPNLPHKTITYYFNNNNISCFSEFWDSLSIDVTGNPFSCLPNYIPSMNATMLAFPLCVDGDSLNNPNGCLGARGITGSVYKDVNSNCSMGFGDQTLLNLPVKLYDMSNNLLAQTYTLSNGIYNFYDTAGTYNIQLDTAGMPFSVQCAFPGTDSSVTLTGPSPLISNVNFAVQCKPGFDVGVQAVHSSGWVFPGIQHQLQVVAGDLSTWFNLHCAAGVSGQVEVTITGPVVFDSVAAGALTPSVSGNVFTYTIADYGNVDIQNDFRLMFTTDTAALEGDYICVSVTVSPVGGDSVPYNNTGEFCYQVTNSYDPNGKEVYPVNLDAGFQDWLTYTIHFQNTGNAPAMNIRLEDTLDSNLDMETFQVINYSHYNTLLLNGSALTFHFPNIMLPDSASNPEASQGYVQYRIKPLSGLPVGTTIDNTAFIYFDFNPAIVTNTTVNEFVSPLTVNDNKSTPAFDVFPNPSNGKFVIKLSDVIGFSEWSIEVHNLMGELVLKTRMESQFKQVDLSSSPNGIYFISVKGNGQLLNQRVIKQR